MTHPALPSAPHPSASCVLQKLLARAFEERSSGVASKQSRRDRSGSHESRNDTFPLTVIRKSVDDSRVSDPSRSLNKTLLFLLTQTSPLFFLSFQKPVNYGRFTSEVPFRLSPETRKVIYIISPFVSCGAFVSLGSRTRNNS